MPSRIEKLEAHTSHLLDAFLKLRERYSILDPMLYDKTVCEQFGSGTKARGFSTLRYSLFLTCVQDIAKLIVDSDPRMPSIKNLMDKLSDCSLCEAFRRKYAVWVVPPIEESMDLDVIGILKKMELQEQSDREVQFEEILNREKINWEALNDMPCLSSFQTIRDKIVAHTEVCLVLDKYQFVDISSLGIKWSDVNKVIQIMQLLVNDIGLIIRNTGFAWESFDEQLDTGSKGFWSS